MSSLFNSFIIILSVLNRQNPSHNARPREGRGIWVASPPLARPPRMEHGLFQVPGGAGSGTDCRVLRRPTLSPATRPVTVRTEARRPLRARGRPSPAWWAVGSPSPGSKEQNQAACGGRKAPSPAIPPLGVCPTALPAPGRWPLLKVPQEGCSHDPGHIHITGTPRQRNTCQRRTAKTHCSVAKAKSR